MSLISLPLMSSRSFTAGTYLLLCCPLPGVCPSPLLCRWSLRLPPTWVLGQEAQERISELVLLQTSSSSQLTALLALPTPGNKAGRPGHFRLQPGPTPGSSPGASSLTLDLVSRAEKPAWPWASLTTDSPLKPKRKRQGCPRGWF